MYPTEKQLLKQLQKSAGHLMAQLQSNDQLSTLASMDSIINELLLRENKAFYSGHYQAGIALAKEALSLAGNILNPEMTQTITDCESCMAADVSPDVRRGQWITLAKLLEDIVYGIGDPRNSQLRDLLKRIVEWDVAFLAHRLSRAQEAGPDSNAAIAIDQGGLLDYLKTRQPGWRDLKITSFYRVPGGFSKCTILFDTDDSVNGPQSFAIRAEQPIHLLELDGSDITNEYPVVRRAFEAGIPVAEPLWLETESHPLKARFMVSRKANGVNFGTATGATSTLHADAVRNLADVLARIHRIPVSQGEPWVEQCHFAKWLGFGATRGNTQGRLREWHRQMAIGDIYPAPQIARAMTWLEANVPAFDGPPVFLHGDYGPHNILLDGNQVGAVLDWEVSTMGDAAYDVCWFLNCTAGSVDRQQFLDFYYAADGQPISEYRLRYFEVFASLFMPITANAALRVIENQDSANVNLAYYGLQFGHEYASRLLASIDRAEAVKHLQ